LNHLIIDGFGLAFRSFFAFNTLMTKTGVQSGCVYGFLCGLRSLKKKHPAFHVTIAWDNDAKRKKAVFPDYKALRPKHAITEQILDLKTLFTAVNVTQAEVPGEEADDVVATLARRYSSEGLVYIHSSDKDLLQLVRDGKIIMIRPKTGGIPDKFYDEEAVRQEFGVGPQDLACYLAFRGDTVDNVPGVARVPSKIIASMVNQYKSPEAIYGSGHINNLTAFQKSSFLSHESQSKVNYSIVNLRDDLSCEMTEGAPEVGKLETILSKYEIQSISAGSLIALFDDKAFLERNSPAIENYSLF
jgi:DNA polymerase-1